MGCKDLTLMTQGPFPILNNECSWIPNFQLHLSHKGIKAYAENETIKLQ